MAEDTNKKKLVGRHKRVAFMDVTGDGKTYTRMTGFTSLSDGKNSTEYSRQYVDEASERSDVVGYAPSMDYEFDLYTNDAVQKKLATITDDELLGSDAQVTVVVLSQSEKGWASWSYVYWIRYSKWSDILLQTESRSWLSGRQHGYRKENDRRKRILF